MNATTSRRIRTRPPSRPPEYGPTPERLAKAQGYVDIGDDQRGGKIYTFRDCTMDRLYSRLTKAAKGRHEEDGLRREYVALMKYKHHWHAAGLLAAIGSVDLNRIFASDPGSMSGMAKSEQQAHHRGEYRKARDKVGHRPGIVLDNVVCADLTLEMAGYAIGVAYASPYRQRLFIVDMLRGAGRDLAEMWGIG